MLPVPSVSSVSERFSRPCHDAGMEIWDAWTSGSNNNKHVSNRTINLVFGQLAQVRSLLVMPITFMQGCRVVTRVI